MYYMNYLSHLFKVCVFLAVAILFVNKDLEAQDKQRLSFDRITAEKGLPSTSVHVIIQDSQGLIWIGTENGLCFYDGYDFKSFQNAPNDSNSVSDNWILSLLEDRDGNIWVGTHSGGLNKFDKKTGKFTNFKVIADNLKSLKNNRVWAIFEDDDGTLFFGTSGGLNIFNRDKKSYINLSNNPLDKNSLSNDAVNDIYKDLKGNIWIATFGGGLNKLVKNGNKYSFERFDDISGLELLSTTKIKKIVEDKQGIIWLGTFSDGLIRFDPVAKSIYKYQFLGNNSNNNRIISLNLDKLGNLWIGSHQNGLYVLNNMQLSSTNYQTYLFENYTNVKDNLSSISDNSILEIYQDKSGILWFGTNRGINKLNPYKEKFKLYSHDKNNPYSLSDDIIKSVFQDSKGNIWIGTYNGGLNKFSIEENKFVVYKNSINNPNSISDNTVWAIKEDNNGILWIGTSYGLNRFDPNTNKFEVLQKDLVGKSGLRNNNISTLYFDSYGYLWIGTWGSGLSVYDIKSDKFYNYFYEKSNPNSLSNDQVKFIYEDSKNNIWIGTLGGGLNKVNRHDILDNSHIKFTHIFSNSSNINSLSSNSLTSICEDGEYLYFGTYGGGVNSTLLNKIDPSKEPVFERFLKEDGLAGNTVYGIISDNIGGLWISTNNGISKYDVKNKYFSNFNVSDGLQGNDFEQGCFRLQDGRIIFGGINGFNLFDPKEILLNKNNTNIILTSVKVFNKDILSIKDIFNTNKIELDGNNLAISFEFAGLDYQDASKIIYRYKLEGVDEDWIYSGPRRFINYTNLSGGKYVLKIAATNSSGIWNENAKEIFIEIKAPFYKSFWSIPFYLLVLSGLLVLVFRKQISKHKNIVEKQNKIDENIKVSNESSKKTEEIKNILYEVSNAINISEDISEYLLKIDKLIKSIIFENNFAVISYDEINKKYFFQYFYDETSNDDNKKEKIQEKMETLLSQVISFGETLEFNNNKDENIDSDFSFGYFIGFPLKNAKGNVIGIMAIYSYKHDFVIRENEKSILTFIAAQTAFAIERKRAEDVRRKYDFIVNTSGSFMTLINSSYIYEAVNDAFCKSHKLDRDKIIGKSIADIWGQYDFDTKIKNYFNLTLAGEVTNYQAWLETKNTGMLCYDISYYPYKDEKGEITHVVVVSRDITALVKAEETVRKLLLAVEQTDEVIFTTDINGKITYVNPAFEKVYGFYKDEVIDKTPAILKSEFMQEEDYNKLWTSVISGKSYKAEFINKTKTGELIEVENSVSPFFDSFNNILGFISVQRDISERKKIEKTLRDAKDAAESSDKLKGEFLAQLSHEIRTPLNSLINSASLIQEEVKEVISEDITVLFDSVTSSAKRIIRTVHMILNMSELQTNTYEYIPKYITLNEKVDKLLNDYKLVLEEKGLQIVKNNNLENSNIFGDEYSIEQILTQLIDNAVKFTDTGIIDITIDKNKFNELEIKIKDTGIGISEFYQEKLYQPFSQEEQGYKRKYDGNGLGLALVKKYCELNNAEINCISSKGLGTEFIITFNNSKVF